MSSQPPVHSDVSLLAARFGALVEAVPDAMMLLNSEGCIALVNGSAEKMFGYPKSELLGKRVEALLPERCRNIQPAESGGRFTPSAPSSSELFGLRKDGSEIPIEISRKPVSTEEGTWETWVVRDLTECKRIRKELKEQSAAMESAKEEFHAFSYSISHDLRAPLRAIDGFATMLKRSLGENLSQETAHSVKRIQDNVTKMSALIEGLLDYSTLSWVALTKKTVQPADLAKNVFNELCVSQNGRVIDFMPGEMPPCKADVALLRRVFENLLSNALKFTRKQDRPVIRVGCSAEDGEQVYFVQDNGVGFDMEYSGKLFHVFQRLHSQSDFEGTGIGLAIVQRIAQRHGGRVWAEAQVDQGATFYFTLGGSMYGNSA
jgi:PAS domain S-box-containing protein